MAITKCMKTIFTLVLVLFAGILRAQTWSDDVASIVYNKCAVCHHNGGIAPFSLVTYDEVSPMAAAIHEVVVNDAMPPWPPNNNYQQYSHSRALSAGDKATMVSWLTNGYPEGNSANTPPPPVFSSGSILGPGDLTVQIPTYMSKAQGGQDDYVCFALPTGLAQQRVVKAIEIIPGNREIVHHALVYIDDGSYQTDTVGGDCGGPQNATLIGGYTPGASPLVFPNGPGFKLGMTLPVGSNIVLAMHYPEGSYGMYDSTKVIFHFYPPGETGIRDVQAAPILQNWSLSLPPNQVTSATAQYPFGGGGIPVDVSVLSVFPHMHLIGEQIRAYAIPPVGDTVKFVRIDHWDFHWQDFYFFRHIQKAPAGSVIKGEAVYNNTVFNEHNPNNPPQHVYAGESTTDEMFLVYFHYMPYQNGDELYDLQDLMNVGLTDLNSKQQPDWNIYPVPFTENVTIEPLSLKEGDLVSLLIYDSQGNLVRTLALRQSISADFDGYLWDGQSESGTAVQSGTYFVSMNRNGVFSAATLLKR